MALRWLDGFESATSDGTTHGRLWASATGSLFPVDGASIPSDEAVSSGDAVLTTPVLVGSPENTWIVGLAFRGDDDALNSGSIPYVGLENTDGEQVRFEFVEANDPNGKPGGTYYAIRVMRGATELATSNEVFQFGAAQGPTSGPPWVYFEFKVTVDNTSGAFEGRYEFCRKPARNGGSPVALTWDAASSSVDTQEQASTGADRLVFSMATGVNNDRVELDDIYIADSTGAKNNDFIGRLVIQGQKPSGDGNSTDWVLAGGASSTEDAWNEPLGNTEDDKRLTSDTTNDEHLCTVSALSDLLACSIVGVRQDFVARMATTGDLDISHMLRKTTGTPAQTNAGTALNVSSTTYQGSALVLEDDPNTTTDWDVADLDSYQHGVRNDG